MIYSRNSCISLWCTKTPLVIENLKWADFVLSSDLNQNFSNYMQDLKILVTQKTAYKWNTTVTVFTQMREAKTRGRKHSWNYEICCDNLEGAWDWLDTCQKTFNSLLPDFLKTEKELLFFDKRMDHNKTEKFASWINSCQRKTRMVNKNKLKTRKTDFWILEETEKRIRFFVHLRGTFQVTKNR